MRRQPPASNLDEGPLRTCSGCRTRRPQARLLRVAKRPDGTISADREGVRSAGRGAYVCRSQGCVRKAVRGGLARALRHTGALPEGLEDELMARVEHEHLPASRAAGHEE